LPYRKDKKRDFIGHPTQDLMTMRGDIEQLFCHREGPFIVAGDLNDEHATIPQPLSKMGADGTRLVDPFAGVPPKTYEQDWMSRRQFTLDYMYLSESLASQVVNKLGGIADFPTAFTMSDHAPLMAEVRV